MNNNYMKMLNVSEVQIMDYHFIINKMAIIRKSDTNKCWRGYGGMGTLTRCWWARKMVQLLWKTDWQFPKELNMTL